MECSNGRGLMVVNYWSISKIGNFNDSFPKTNIISFFFFSWISENFQFRLKIWFSILDFLFMYELGCLADPSDVAVRHWSFLISFSFFIISPYFINVWSIQILFIWCTQFWDQFFWCKFNRNYSNKNNVIGCIIFLIEEIRIYYF